MKNNEAVAHKLIDAIEEIEKRNNDNIFNTDTKAANRIIVNTILDKLEEIIKDENSED